MQLTRIMSPAALIILPAGAAATAALGAAYGVLTVANPHALLNAFAVAMAVFAVGFVCIWTVRLSKLRHAGVALLLALSCAAAFLIAGVYSAREFSGSTLSFWGFLGERRRTGVTLIAGYVHIRGVWLVLGWILGSMLIVLACLFTAGVESGRPFCTACRSWAWKPRWKFSLPNPSQGAVAALKSSKSVDSILEIRSGPPSHPPQRLEVRLGACDCGAIATINVNAYSRTQQGESAPDSLISDAPAGLAYCRRLFDWAESISPSMRSSRPELFAARPAGKPLDISPAPADGRHRSYNRWDGWLGASDSYCDNDYTRALRERLREGDYTLVDQALAAQRNPEDFSFVAEACADWQSRPAWLDIWADERPDSANMLLIRGITSVKEAWKARGNGWVPRNYAAFQQHLYRSEVDLRAAADANPKDATALAWMIYAAKGLQHERSVMMSLLQEAHKRVPFFRPAYSFALDFLAPKWGGSEDDMRQLARKVLASAPAGRHALVIVAEAHLELAYSAFRNHKRPALDAYWAQPAVAEELRAASEKCFRTGSHRESMDTPRTRAYFAFTLWKAGAKEAAAEQLRIIGNATPWGPFTPGLLFTGQTVRKARRACLVG